MPCALIAAFVLLFWLTGLHVTDLARGLTGLLLLGMLLFRGRWLNRTPWERWLRIACLIFLACYGLFLFTEPLLPVFTGAHGIDFAIFSQAVDSIARFGRPYTSLLGLQRIDFLGHHFVPFLYLPGGLAALGLPSHLALSVLQALSGISTGVLFYVFARQLRFSRFMALMATTLIFANPSVRHGLFYGVHDEIFALPFLMLAFLCWNRGSLGLMALVLILATSTKESIAAVGVAMIVMTFFDKKTVKSPRQVFILGATAVLLAMLFFGYIFLQPILLKKSFDHIGKVATLSQLLAPDILFEKIAYGLFLLLPFLFFPLLAWRQWHLFLPATPLLGIALVSNVRDMWAPLNYYGVLPSFLLAAGSLIALSRWDSLRARWQDPFVLALMICLSFSFSTKKPTRTIVNALTLPTYQAAQLAMIPAEAEVIASPAAALFLFQQKNLWRLGNATDKTPESFDFVVRKKGHDLEELDAGLAARVELCRDTGLWLIYCNKSPRLSLRDP